MERKPLRQRRRRETRRRRSQQRATQQRRHPPHALVRKARRYPAHPRERARQPGLPQLALPQPGLPQPGLPQGDSQIATARPRERAAMLAVRSAWSRDRSDLRESSRDRSHWSDLSSGFQAAKRFATNSAEARSGNRASEIQALRQVRTLACSDKNRGSKVRESTSPDPTRANRRRLPPSCFGHPRSD